MALLKGTPKKPAAVAANVAAELEKPAAKPVAAKAAPVKSPTQAAAKAAVKAKPAPAPAPAPEPVAETESIEIADMDEEQLAALVAEHEIETPPDWSTVELEDKKAWLNEHFGEADDEPAKEEAATAEEPEVADDEPEPVKAAAKAPRKPKAKAVTAAGKSGEILPPDLITEVAGELENLKEAEARKLVTELREGSDFGFFKLGGVLSVIQANNWIEPHGSFRDFVESEHGLNYRRAMYWIGIYNGLVESKIPWDAVKSLGWTKLKEIVPVLTKGNVKQWVKIAEKQTTLQLNATVKASIEEADQKKLGNDTPSEPPKKVMTKTFKVHEDQKATIDAALTRAKSASNTEFDAVALEMICLDFMGGSETAGTLAGMLQKMGLDDALKVFETAFPQVSLTAEIDGEVATE